MKAVLQHCVAHYPPDASIETCSPQTDVLHSMLCFSSKKQNGGWCGAEFLPDNPYDTLTLGCDFVRNHAPPHIDFCSIHLWPDSWLPNGDSEEAALRFARRWINAHVDCCTSQLAKPLVLAEFGKKPAGAPRAAFYQKVGS